MLHCGHWGLNILYALKNKRIRLYSKKTLKYALIFHLRLFLKDVHHSQLHTSYNWQLNAGITSTCTIHVVHVHACMCKDQRPCILVYNTSMLAILPVVGQWCGIYSSSLLMLHPMSYCSILFQVIVPIFCFQFKVWIKRKCCQKACSYTYVYALIFGGKMDCKAHVRLFLGCAYYWGALILECIQ